MPQAVEDCAAEMTHLVTLRFEDGVEKQISVAPGQFVLDAALRQGVPLVHQCRSGSCSTCVAQVVAGEIGMARDRSTSLLALEAAEGKRLLCSAYALVDSVARLHYPASLIYERESQLLGATVSAISWPASSVARLTLELDETANFDFHPGQYVRIKVPGTTEWRSYSMATVSRELPQMDFLVRILAGGLMSEYLSTRCRPGDRLEVEGPMGAFILHPSRAQHIFVAGGTGIAPIIGMLDGLRRRPGPRPPMLLSFGCALASQFFYRDEVELRQWWMPELRVILSADRIDSPVPGVIETTPVAALGVGSVNDPDAVAYLCGPPPMIAAARARLIELGVAPDHIYAEQFVASSIG